VQHADTKGYQYAREDVDARALANLYAQHLGLAFTHEMKPLEIEILVAEVGNAVEDDQLFHILYDGTVTDEKGYAVLGGDSEAIDARLKESFADGAEMGIALQSAVKALAGPERTLAAEDLEIAVLDRSLPRRAFRRLADGEVTSLLA
jgi:proteasome alpha subunit